MTVAAPPGPYKGLVPFGESALDALLFFGRERETEIVAANLLAYRLTVLYGESGVGKSSLLRAGVAHRLRESGEDLLVFDAWGGDPASSLLAQLPESVDREHYVILDQFDEYFIYHETGGDLAPALAALVTDPERRVNVLISIRDDMLSRLDLFKALVPNLFSNYLRLDHLDRRAARDAIVGPLERYNGIVPEAERMSAEPALVEAVLDGSGSDGRIEAPYLQLVMQRLWEEERRADERTLRLATLEHLGGPEMIVRTHLAVALASLSERERNLASELFNHLVTPSGTKIAHGIGDLAQYACTSEGEIAPVLDALVHERIVRPVTTADASGTSRYEIFHDVLAEPVVAWRSRYVAEQQLEWTREEARRRHRRLLVLAGVALFAVVVMAGLTIFAFAQRRAARSEAMRAHGRELAARALVGLDLDPQKSLREALGAARLSPGVASEDTLRRVLVRSYERLALPQGAAVSTVTFSPNGNRFAAAVSGGEVRVFSSSGHLLRSKRAHGPVGALVYDSSGRVLAATSLGGRVRVYRSDGRLSSVLHNPGPVSDVALSPHGDLAAAVAKARDGHSRARIFAIPSGRLLHVLPEIGVSTAAFSPDGRVFATGSADRTARTWNARTGRLLSTLPHQGGVTSLDFSRDGRLLATASEDGLGRIWDTSTGGSVVVLPGSTQPLRGISFSDDGRFVVTASRDGKAHVYRVEDSLLVAVLVGSRGPVNSAVFSPSGRRVVTGSDDGTVRLWDPGAEDQLRLVRRVPDPVIARFGSAGRIVTGPVEPARGTAISPDGRFVARTEGTEVLLTDRKSGRTQPLAGHFASVYTLSFSPDSRWLATGSQFAAILWRVRLGAKAELFSYLYGHEPTFRGKPAHLTSVAFSSDGRRIVTASLDHTVRVYDCDVCGGLGSLVELARHRLSDISVK